MAVSIAQVHKTPQKDWKTVEKLRTTHRELAGHLRDIWNIVKGKKTPYRFSYSVNLGDGQSLPQQLRGKIEPLERDTLILRNLSNAESLNITKETISSIEESGFYEEKDSLYRIDPIKLVAILTGKTPRIQEEEKESDNP